MSEPFTGTSPLEWLFALETFGIKFGLHNITTLLDALGRPDGAFAAIHVGGTNGKGSVTAMVDAVLRAAGHRSARYTSPHLVAVNERFVVDGRQVGDALLWSAVSDVRLIVDELVRAGRLEALPTFFEVTTAVAFELFRRAGVELAVCEVGLGGRLDATNVLEPRVCAITSIGFDHEEYLGHSIAEIAAEKAGIIKRGVPVVAGRLAPEAMQVIAAVAEEQGAELVRAADTSTVTDLGDATSGEIQVETAVRRYPPLRLALAGSHQVDNALVAIGVLEWLDAHGVPAPAPAIVAGLGDVRWPGRLERRMLPDGREVLLDAAHNVDGTRALAAYLRQTGERAPLVFAVMRDKDSAGMIGALAPFTSTLIMTRASNARSREPEELAELARRVAPGLTVLVEPALPRALAAAWKLSPRIVVAGSIFLLGDAMRELGLS